MRHKFCGSARQMAMDISHIQFGSDDKRHKLDCGSNYANTSTSIDRFHRILAVYSLLQDDRPPPGKTEQVSGMEFDKRCPPLAIWMPRHGRVHAQLHPGATKHHPGVTKQQDITTCTSGSNSGGVRKSAGGMYESLFTSSCNGL